MTKIFSLIGFGFVFLFVCGVFYYTLGRILLVFRSDMLRRIGHFFLAASGIADSVTVVKKCPRICDGKCKIWTCPLYNTKNVYLFSDTTLDRIIREEDSSDDEDRSIINEEDSFNE